MSYTITNFKTKKALKEAVELYNAIKYKRPNFKNINAVRCYQSKVPPDLMYYTGRLCIAGPHPPAKATWYAEAELKDGIVVKVK